MQRRWPAVLAVATMLCACGQPVDGVAVAGVPGITEQFDPCSIPDDAIAATGLDPGTKEVGWGPGLRKPQWKRCVWQGPAEDPWYYYEVLFSVGFSDSNLRQNAELSELEDVVLGGRDVVAYRFIRTDPAQGCGAGFDTFEGVTMLSVDALGGIAPRGDPCQLVLRHTEDLSEYFPTAT